MLVVHELGVAVVDVADCLEAQVLVVLPDALLQLQAQAGQQQAVVAGDVGEEATAGLDDIARELQSRAVVEDIS